MTVLEAPLDKISAQARPYPAYLLPKGGTALALFAAAFLGHNDSIHFARNDMLVTCIDTDCKRLEQMQELYPDDWLFECEDAWIFAMSAYASGARWDIVSVDAYTGDAGDSAIRTLALWCLLARKAVTVTIRNDQPYTEQPGWRSGLFPRSNKVSWLVLTRA